MLREEHSGVAEAQLCEGGKHHFLRSGRECLFTIIKALGLPTGARVGVPLYCCASVFEAISAAGGVPVFLDLDPKTYSIDLDSLQRHRHDLDTVVIVHTFGYPSDLTSVRDCLGSRQIPIIEDCAHALFSEYQGKRLGTMTQVSFLSFGIHKPAAIGGGGMVIFNDPELEKRAAQQISLAKAESRWSELRHAATCWIRAFAYHRVVYGLLLASPFNRFRDPGPRDKETERYAVTAIRQCDRVLLAGRVEQFRKRLPYLARNASRIRLALQGSSLQTPHEPPYGRWNHFLTPVRYRNERHRSAGRRFLLRHHVDTAPLYQNCVEAAYRFGYSGDCPNAENAAQTVCTIPHHSWLSDREVEFICESVRASDEISCDSRPEQDALAI